MLFIAHSSVVVFGCLSEHNLRAVRLPEVICKIEQSVGFTILSITLRFSLRSITIIINHYNNQSL